MATIVYSDIDMNLGIDTKSSDIRKSIDLASLKNSINNILTTRKMERRMLPEFGASLEQLLFEPVDMETAQKIGEIMLQELEFWEPRIYVENIQVIADEDNSRFNINLTYSIQSPSISRDNISFVLSQ